MTTLLARSLARSAALGAIAASLFTTLLHAQDRDALPATALRPAASPILPGPTAPDGTPSGVWAGGPSYKVSFHDGMTFYPYVGAELPHQPVRWRTTSVRAGSAELLRANGAPVARYAGYRCEYDLGGVTERYDVRDAGVEQSFVVHERPAAGDLVVTGEITTPLVLPAMAAAHGALSLCLPDGRAVVDYGAAIAIDRNGVQTPVTTMTDGKHILLRVAAETVAAAAFPLVIDPLIGTNVQLAIGNIVDEVDVLHETLTALGANARTWVAYSVNAAAGDKDIFLYRYPAYFGPAPGTLNYREISAWDSTHGRLALAPSESRVILVHSTDTGANRFVLVHSHHTTDNNLVTQAVVVPGSLGLSDWRPDVGGRLQPSGSKVLITFQREAVAPFANTANSTVFATVFDASLPLGSAFTVAPFVLLQRPNADQERPVVNQYAASNTWLVAFQEHNGAVANDDWDITTIAVDGNGGGTAVETQLDVAQAGDPLLHKIVPEIAGSFGRFVLTYGTRVFELPNPKPLGEAGSTIHAQRLDWTFQTNTGSLPHAVVTVQPGTANVLINGGIAFDPSSESHWCAGFQNTGLDRYRLSKLGFSGKLVEGAAIDLAVGATPSAIAITFNEESRRFPIVFAENDGTATGNLVQGTMMDYVAAAPPTLVGFACGSGVWTGLTATGDRTRIGSQAMPLRLANAPQDTAALLFLSTAQLNLPADAFGAPGCVLVPDILSGAYLGAVAATISGGNALLTIDLPPTLAPMELVLQWAYLVPGANPLGMQASEGLTVDIDR